VVELASDIWKELKKAFEGKAVTEYYILLGSINDCPLDDRITTIDAHITEYERRWNCVSSIISRASIKDDDNFGKGLVLISKSEQAKAEFLLQPIPSFYGNTVENIRGKDYEVEDVS
jgi:hypothetical protein